jgi:hypothetical protein
MDACSIAANCSNFATGVRVAIRRAYSRPVKYHALKAGKPCADCGLVVHPAAMQWDHLPGTPKHADLGDLVRTDSKARILAEIAFCELVCANCHAVRTFVRRRGVAQPG